VLVVVVMLGGVVVAEGPMFAAEMASSCRRELAAPMAFEVARVTCFVARTRSSGLLVILSSSCCCSSLPVSGLLVLKDI